MERTPFQHLYLHSVRWKTHLMLQFGRLDFESNEWQWWELMSAHFVHVHVIEELLINRRSLRQPIVLVLVNMTTHQPLCDCVTLLFSYFIRLISFMLIFLGLLSFIQPFIVCVCLCRSRERERERKMISKQKQRSMDINIISFSQKVYME